MSWWKSLRRALASALMYALETRHDRRSAEWRELAQRR